MDNKGQCDGKLFVTKYNREFFVSFVAAGKDDIERFMYYIEADENTVARMLFTRGFIDESRLFRLVDEGDEYGVLGPFPMVMLLAIALGLGEVPEDADEFIMDLDTLLDPPGTRKLAE